VIDRVDRLARMPRPASGYPLEWSVESYFLGDLDALAMLAVRSADAAAAGDC
jgi:hypothetical protein